VQSLGGDVNSGLGVTAFAALLTGLGGGCGPGSGAGEDEEEARWARMRATMVERQIVARGIQDPRVLEVMRQVPRHLFVPLAERGASYEDRPLRIGAGQTISQPYIVALMTEACRVGPADRVLEIGTGSGYQTAVLAALAREVYSIEIVAELAESARRTFDSLGLCDVHLRTGDGFRGWPEAAPFDAILVTAAPEETPGPLLDQLAVGGRLVIPVGPEDDQRLLRIVRTAQGLEREVLAPVRFVPMTGEAQRTREDP
jgi:protein-L-isoaspartate(D-aspartate) O-methyltransferase